MRTIQFLAVVAALFFVGCGAHPTDASLHDRFFRKEVSFNKLVQMAHEDSRMTRIAPDFTWPGGKQVSFSTQRWDEYRALFRDLGVDLGMNRLDRNDGVMLIVSATGIVGRGTAKGYVHSTKRLDPIVDSLDMGMPRPCVGHKDCIAFKPLKGSWYLFYEIG